MAFPSSPTSHRRVSSIDREPASISLKRHLSHDDRHGNNHQLTMQVGVIDARSR